MEEFDNMVLWPPELLMENNEFGPNSQSAIAIAKSCCSEQVWKSIVAVSNSYKSSNQYLFHQKWLQKKTTTTPQRKQQMSLTPTLFWYDNVHVCETAHYRDFVFDPLYKMVARGGKLAVSR